MKKNNGITLIALIITIIIMLILVAVSISILINSGLIGKTKEAGSKTKTAYEQESRMGDSITIDGVTYNNIDEYLNSNNQQKLKLRYTIKNEEYQVDKNNTAYGDFLYVTPYIEGVNILNYEDYGQNILATENKTSLFIDAYNNRHGESFATISQIAENLIEWEYDGTWTNSTTINTVEELFNYLCEEQYINAAEYNNSVNEWLINDGYIASSYESYLSNVGGEVNIQAWGGIETEGRYTTILGQETKICESDYYYDDQTDEEEIYLIPMPSNALIMVKATTNNRTNSMSIFV